MVGAHRAGGATALPSDDGGGLRKGGAFSGAVRARNGLQRGEIRYFELRSTIDFAREFASLRLGTCTSIPPRGFEPLIFWLRTRCPRPLDEGGKADLGWGSYSAPKSMLQSLLIVVSRGGLSRVPAWRDAPIYPSIIDGERRQSLGESFDDANGFRGMVYGETQKAMRLKPLSSEKCWA